MAGKAWYDAKDPTGKTTTEEVGLKFTCTQCGNCCTGPTGYVKFTDKEAAAMAKDLGITLDVFMSTYTHDTEAGTSLKEDYKRGYGYDCVFLTRDEQGKSGCSVYLSRPAQCRTWPFWAGNLYSKSAWERASKGCPGMNQGELHAPEFITLTCEQATISEHDQ
jgi:Fe-S-cluster containining protein